MKSTIYLIVDRSGVRQMNKNMPQVRRGELVVKLNVVVPEEAFAPPTLEQNVEVEDWQQDFKVDDIEFNENVITGAEAEMIKQARLQAMEKTLKTQGYKVIPPKKKGGSK